jgi:hypothetical protein
VKAIAEGCGRGPFRMIDGRILSVVGRTSKEDPNRTTWFFKGPSQSDVIDV